MRTQLTAKGNRNAGSSCLCDRGLHRYLRNFGGGLNTPNPHSRYATDCQWHHFLLLLSHCMWNLEIKSTGSLQSFFHSHIHIYRKCPSLMPLTIQTETNCTYQWPSILQTWSKYQHLASTLDKCLSECLLQEPLAQKAPIEKRVFSFISFLHK